MENEEPENIPNSENIPDGEYQGFPQDPQSMEDEAPVAPAEGEAPNGGDGKHRKSHGHGPGYYYGQQTIGHPIYYSAAPQRPHYGGGPKYGGASYGAYGSYNSYGGSYGVLPYYGRMGGEDSEQNSGDSFLGPLSIRRIIRIILQKWPTLVVAVLLGLGAGFAYFKAAPSMYKTSAIIEMQIKRQRIMNTADVVLNSPDTQGSTEEIFNTRLAMLRSYPVIKLVVERIRAEYPALKLIEDSELNGILISNVDFTLRRRSRLVIITVTHTNPEIAQSVANAYAYTVESYSSDANKEQSEAGVAWLKSTAESRRHDLDRADAAVLKFKTDNKLGLLKGQNESLLLANREITSDIARAESHRTRLTELLATLTDIQNDPTKITSLPESVPRIDEIKAIQKTITECVTQRDLMLTHYTDKNPDVVRLNSRIDALNEQFKETVWRSRETAAANLDLMTKQIEALKQKKDENVGLQSEINVQISEVENKLKQLIREQNNAATSYQRILSRMEEARIATDDSSATVRVIEEARLPSHPFSPNPKVAFTAGPAVGFIIGFLFILVLDRIEDNITSSDDIERHMGTRVLSILPHVPRVKRNELVTLAVDKKFSRFSEAFAGLRGLLDSPRYIESSKVIMCVSTQPEEGKTVTSSNLASSYAMAGKKTLLIDFDMRRPRIGRMFGKADDIDRKHSLIDVLANGDISMFEGLPVSSGYDNLDLIMSRPSSHFSPASVIGSDMLPKLFDFVRNRYEHVIIDTPPFGLVSDVLSIGPFCDSAIIVCRPERSKFKVVRHALLSLLESGTKVIGAVVNDVPFSGGSSFSSSYNGYSSSYGYGKYGYGGYGKYGRYGYGGGYYKRNLATEGGAANASRVEAPEQAQPGTSTHSHSSSSSTLEVDDDE